MKKFYRKLLIVFYIFYISLNETIGIGQLPAWHLLIVLRTNVSPKQFELYAEARAYARKSVPCGVGLPNRGCRKSKVGSSGFVPWM